jgi:hypothetical protein
MPERGGGAAAGRRRGAPRLAERAATPTRERAAAVMGFRDLVERSCRPQNPVPCGGLSGGGNLFRFKYVFRR